MLDRYPVQLIQNAGEFLWQPAPLCIGAAKRLADCVGHARAGDEITSAAAISCVMFMSHHSR